MFQGFLNYGVVCGGPFFFFFSFFPPRRLGYSQMGTPVTSPDIPISLHVPPSEGEGKRK